MRLLEYQGKELFSKYGIPIPPSELVFDQQGVLEASKKIGFPLVPEVTTDSGRAGKGWRHLEMS